MSTTVTLYRKYRPQNFDEVRDQDHIISVLKGAIKKGEIPHAILFSGTRGTGKTTLARIFARAIGTEEVDLYEIDAASNNGVDDVRELREAVHTLPFKSQQKVYIIDEVHMLSKSAFNALLKTLEEPPLHVVFILATTEEDKMLETILSRCQVFRMHSPSRSVLAEIVTDVAKSEGFTLSPSAADLIAITADGSFRDALGVTQKVILASGDKIGSVDEVASIIGAPKSKQLRKLMDALHTQDVARALEVVHEVSTDRVDMKLFMRLLLERVRAVMLLRNLPSRKADFLDRFDVDTQKELAQYADVQTPLNSHLLRYLLSATEQMARAPLPQLPLEIAIVDALSNK